MKTNKLLLSNLELDEIFKWGQRLFVLKGKDGNNARVLEVALIQFEKGRVRAKSTNPTGTMISLDTLVEVL